MAKIKIALIVLLTSALFLGACGRRGPLERPPQAEKEEKQDKFVLDPLI